MENVPIFIKADNTYTKSVIVTIPSDINGDKIVDILDAIILSYHWRHNEPWLHPDTDPNADINSDCVINIFDAVILSTHYGQSW